MGMCPGCGLELPEAAGPTHAYLTVSPACWTVFNRSMALHYQDQAYWPSHQPLVDAYAVQHSPGPDRRARQSVAVHLAALCARIEHGANDAALIRLRKALAHGEFVEIAPPPPSVWITDVALGDAETHAESVNRFVAAVWQDWSTHHAQARAWVEQGYA